MSAPTKDAVRTALRDLSSGGRPVPVSALAAQLNARPRDVKATLTQLEHECNDGQFVPGPLNPTPGHWVWVD